MKRDRLADILADRAIDALFDLVEWALELALPDDEASLKAATATAQPDDGTA